MCISYAECSSVWLVSGNNKKLKLTGRPSDVAGVLATGKLYTLGEQSLAFFPQVCNLPLIAELNVESLRFGI